MRPFLVLTLLLAGSASASDIDGELRQALQSIEQLRLEAAREQLTRTLSKGEATPGQTAQLHLGLGRASAAMGYPPAALRSFRKALLVDPALELPLDASPKLLQPFDEARTTLAGRRLLASIRSEQKSAGGAVETQISVQADDESLVAGARVWRPFEPTPAVQAAISGQAITTRWTCTERPCAHWVALVDTHGNELLVVGSTQVPLRVQQAPPPLAPSVGVPWFRRPTPFLVLAGLSAGAAVYFGTQFSSRQGELEALNSNRTTGTYVRAVALDEGRRSHHAAMWVSLGLMSASGAVAVYNW